RGPDQSVPEAGATSHFGLDGCMGHGWRMTKQRPYAAQALGEREELRLRGEAFRFFRVGGQLEGDDRSKILHLPSRDVVAIMVGEAREMDLRHFGMDAQESGNGARILAVPLHADGKCLDPAQNQETI